MFRHLAFAFTLSAALAFPVFAQDSTQNKNLDVQSPMGDLHVGSDADALKAGLPLYPDAHAKHDENNDPLNLGILTESFGLKLIVAKYESNDAPAKVIDFYRDKMRKYGKVLECHSLNDNSGSHGDNDQESNKPLKCEGDNAGPVRELKVGTEGNARVVAIEPRENGTGTSFTIVYWQRRGKSGDI